MIKKLNKLLLFTVLAFICFITTSNAQSTYIKVCEYNHTYGDNNESSQVLGIYYMPYNNSFYVLADNSNTSPVEYNDTENIFKSNSYIDNTNTICPTYGFYNHDWFSHHRKKCFSEDEKYCAANYNAGGINFNGTSEKIYDINDEITEFFRGYSYDFEISDDPDILSNYTFNRILSEVTSDMKDKLYDDFTVQNSFDSEEGLDDVYQFIINATAYKTVANNTAQDIVDEIKRKKEEVAQDSSTTDDQKDRLESSQAELEGNAQDYEEEIVQSSKLNININMPTEDNCDSYLGNKDVQGTPAWYLKQLFNVIQYGAIVLCLVLTIVEFFKAATSQDDSAMKKAGQKTLKRIIITVILFVSPTIIEFILELLGIMDTCMPV